MLAYTDRQVYSNASEVPVDHESRALLEHDLPPSARRTFEDIIRDGTEVERLRREVSETAAKAHASAVGVNRLSPFRRLLYGFRIDQIRPDIAHTTAVLVRHLLLVFSARRRPGQSKGESADKAPAKPRAPKQRGPRGRKGRPKARAGGSREGAAMSDDEAGQSAAQSGLSDDEAGQSAAQSRWPKRQRMQSGPTEFFNPDDVDLSPDSDSDSGGVEATDAELSVEELDGGGVDGADGATGEVDRIVGERGAPGSPEHQVCVRWLNWSGDPTWNDAATVIEDVPHVWQRWLRERGNLGWPAAGVKEVEQRLSKNVRKVTIGRLVAMTAKKAARKRADHFICRGIVAAPGFTPLPSSEPCQRTGMLNMHDMLKFVDCWGGLYIYKLGLPPEISAYLYRYIALLKAVGTRRVPPGPVVDLRLQATTLFAEMQREMWPESELNIMQHIVFEMTTDFPRWLPRLPNMMTFERCLSSLISCPPRAHASCDSAIGNLGSSVHAC